MQKYIDLDAELHKLDDSDYVDNPTKTLNSIQDKIGEQIKSFGEDVDTIRNSIDSGSNEFSCMGIEIDKLLQESKGI